MSIENEELDIDNVEQIQEEELVDETQVDSYEENLEEKAKVKKEDDEVEEDDVDVEEGAEDGVDGGDGQEVGGDQETAGDAKGAKQSTEIPKTKAGIVNAAYSMMKKAKKDEAVKLYQGMMKAAYHKEDVDTDEDAYDLLLARDSDGQLTHSIWTQPTS